MSLVFITGLIGSLILVIGAAYQDAAPAPRPVQSKKNWLFVTGAFIMLIYAVLSYFSGGPFYFVILEILMSFACVLMMTNLSERLKTIILGVAGLGALIWSISLPGDKTIIWFVLGLVGISVGYVLQADTPRREAALTLGSLLIAYYSYVENSWIFFGLNAVFAIFSSYYLFKFLKKS